MMFIRCKWTNQRKSGYESLKQWCLPLQRKNNDKAGIWKICILHLSFIFYDRWRLNDKSTYTERKFEDECTNASGSSESL